MNSELMTQGLLIAAIGMGLVFVVIIFLWGLMALLMRVTSRKETSAEESLAQDPNESELVPEIEKTEHQRMAAAAVVAVELAFSSLKMGRKSGFKDEMEGALSPWQTFHRSRRTLPEERRG